MSPTLFMLLRTLLLKLSYFARLEDVGRCLVLQQLDMSCYVDTHGRPVLSETKMEEWICGCEYRG